MVSSVCGTITKEMFGVASAHEHVFIDMIKCVDITGNEKEIFYKKFTIISDILL